MPEQLLNALCDDRPSFGPKSEKSSNSIFSFLRDELENRHVCTALQKDDRKKEKKEPKRQAGPAPSMRSGKV